MATSSLDLLSSSFPSSAMNLQSRMAPVLSKYFLPKVTVKEFVERRKVDASYVLISIVQNTYYIKLRDMICNSSSLIINLNARWHYTLVTSKTDIERWGVEKRYRRIKDTLLKICSTEIQFVVTRRHEGKGRNRRRNAKVTICSGEKDWMARSHNFSHKLT